MASSSDPELQPPDTKRPRTESESEEEEDGWKMLMDDIYIKQHFNTTGDEIVDKIFNLSLDHFAELIPTLKKSLTEVATAGKSENEEAAIVTEIDAGLAQYIKSFYSRLEYNSDALLLYIKKYILIIPDSVVLPNDKAQIDYQKLVKTLQHQQKSQDDNLPKYTEENTADLLSDEAEKLHDELLRVKLEKAKMECMIKKADSVLERLDSLESSIESASTVMQNIAAAAARLTSVDSSVFQNGTE